MRGHTQQDGRCVFPTCVGMVRTSSRGCSRLLSFPHMRGDGPCLPSGESAALRFSPHAWGWSGMESCCTNTARVFPTCVGMVRIWSSPQPVARGFPHMRGDGPKHLKPTQKRPWFSPHAWGWSGRGRPQPAAQLVFPTCGGMVRPAAHRAGFCQRFPHMRGDGPKIDGLPKTSKKFSPHAWGWSEFAQHIQRVYPVFPTCVGMVRKMEIFRTSNNCFPHMRGDGPT